MFKRFLNFWRRDAVIVPASGKPLTQNNPLRAGLYERDVKDFKDSLERIDKRLEEGHADAQTFIENVLEKESALQEATDAKMDYVNAAAAIDAKLEKIGGSLLNLIHELRRQTLKGTNLYSGIGAAGSGGAQTAAPSDTNGQTAQAAAGGGKNGRAKFPKQEKDHPLFPAAHGTAEGEAHAASAEREAAAGEEAAETESKFAKIVKSEFSGLKTLLEDTVGQIKTLRADLRESNAGGGGFSSSDDGSGANELAPNSFAPPPAGLSAKELAHLARVPSQLEEIKRMLAAGGAIAGQPKPAAPAGALPPTSAPATNGERANGKPLRIKKVNEKSGSLAVWQWLEDLQRNDARGAAVIWLLIVENDARLTADDLKAIRQECLRQRVLYIANPREAIYVLKNLGSEWDGSLAEEFIGGAPPAGDRQKENDPPAQKSNAPVGTDRPPSGGAVAPSKDEAATPPTKKEKTSEQTATLATAATEGAATEGAETTTGVMASDGKSETAVMNEPVAGNGGNGSNEKTSPNAAVREPSAAARTEEAGPKSGTGAKNNGYQRSGGESKSSKPRPEFQGVKLKEGASLNDLEQAEKPETKAVQPLGALGETGAASGGAGAGAGDPAASPSDGAAQKPAQKNGAVSESFGAVLVEKFGDMLSEVSPKVEEVDEPYN